MSDQEQNTVQTQDAGTDDFATWEAQRIAELTGQSGAGEEQPAAESAEETETSETKEEPKGEEPKGEDPEGEEEGEKPKDEEKPKRKGGFQKRIDRLTRENRELAERLAALEKGESVEPEAKPAAEEDAEPQESDFDNFADFVKATSKWTYRQEQKARAEEEAEAKAKANAEVQKQKAAEGWNVRVEEARKQFQDYDEVLKDAADIEVPQELEAALLEAGPAVLYHLAKNPEEVERIAELPMTSALREIGKIEARIAAESAKEPTPKTQPTKKTTSAPKPVRSLTGNAAQTKGLDDPDIPYSEWEKQRNRKLLQGR